MTQNVQMPFRSNPVPMLMFRLADLQILDANQSALSLYGYTRNQMLGMSIKELRPEHKVPHLIQFLKEEQNGKQVRDAGIHEHLTADGNTLYVKVFPQPYQEGDDNRLVLLQDVTSEVQTYRQNRLLSSVARNTGNGVLIANQHNKIEWVNEAWTRMTGYSLDEAKGKIPGDLLQGSDTNPATAEYISKKIHREEGFQAQILNYRKDGTPFWSNLDVQPVKDEQGNLSHWIQIKEDVSDRIEAEQRVKNSEILFYNALKLAPIPVMLLDENGTISFINSAFEEASGYKLDDIPNVRDWANVALHDSDAVEAVLKTVEQIFATEDIYYGGDYSIYTKDGNRRIWEFWNAPLGYMPNADVQTAIVMAVDVTNLRNTQHELEHQLSKFEQLFDNAPNSLAVTDPAGRILEVNGEFERFFGYDKQEVEGSNIDRLLTSNKAEFEQAQQKTYLLNQKQTFWEESIRYTREGRQVPIYMGGIAVRIKDQVRYLFHIYSDISQITSLLQENQRLLKREQSLRAKAEESQAVFKDMFEEAPEGLAQLEGPEHVYSYTNPAYRRIIGKDHFEGHRVIDVLPETEEQGFLDLLDHVYQNGEVYSASEKFIKIIQDDGSERQLYLNFTYKPLKDTRGETYGIMVHVIDVTNQVKFRRQIELQLKEKQMLLEEIHHRVKNNLAVITSLLYLQQEESDSCKVQASLQEAQNRIQSIALVHKQLYQEAETRASIDMSGYLNSLLEWLMLSSEPPGTSVKPRIDAQKVRVPLAQAVPMGLMATELLTNACKHAFVNKKEGKIYVNLSKDENHIHLQIADNGIGLPEDFSIDTGHTGMDIVQSLLSQLDAELAHDSTNGSGTTFTLKIPAETEATVES